MSQQVTGEQGRDEQERRGYVAAEAEAKWQAFWEADQTFSALDDGSKPRRYVLDMFPYPSGDLHMGHAEAYALGDVIARYWVQQGFNVMHPIGWDAFGLPAENAAMKNGVPPARWTRDNIAAMKAQMQALGLAFDWSREVTTCDPEYYKWNQWFFLKMLEAGVAERRTQVVNWDPSVSVASIPVIIFEYSESPDRNLNAQAWAAAFVLIAFVLVSSLTARIPLDRSRPKLGQSA